MAVRGGHHRLCGISMYASPKCNCIMNDFMIQLLTLTLLVWEKLTHQCHMCVMVRKDYGEERMAVRGGGRPSQIIRYLDVCFAEM